MLTPLENMDVSEKEQNCRIRVSSSFVCVGLNIWFIEEMISHVKCLEHKSLVGISCDRSKRSLQKLDQPAYYTMSTQKDQCLHTQTHTINTLVSLTLCKYKLYFSQKFYEFAT